MKEMTEQQALLKLSALCAHAEHCSYEMTEKMHRWGLPDEVQARIMARLTQERYIDDERYSRLFVREKIMFNKWGRRKVAQALMAKRIDHETIQHVLDDVDDEEYLAVLRPLLKSKRRQLKPMTPYEATSRLVRFALSRGFTMDLIRQCIDVTDEIEDDGEENQFLA
jgi:regulatory protein